MTQTEQASSPAPRALHREAAAARRRELGAFLRARREHVAPHEVGLPPVGRRRTPGLRREELALLAGISTTWYTFLEQGRDVRASEQVLRAIAAALRLDDAGRAHLVALAGNRMPVPDLVERLPGPVAQVPMLLEPNPAYITGVTFDLLAWNPAAERLFDGLAADTDPAPNLARWMFTDPAARRIVLDWQDVAQGLLARLRANAGRHPDSPRFQQLVQDLRSGSAEADAWWPRYDIATTQAGTKRILDPEHGECRLAYASFQAADNPANLLTVYRYE